MLKHWLVVQFSRSLPHFSPSGLTHLRLSLAKQEGMQLHQLPLLLMVKVLKSQYMYVVGNIYFLLTKAPTMVNANELVVLRSATNYHADDGDITYHWQVLVGDLDLSSCGTSESTFATCSDDALLVINPYSLASGAIYRFRLEATSQRGVGWAEVDLQVNPRPAGGCCTVSSSSGLAYTTTFTVQCTNFEVDGAQESSVVTYRFYRKAVGNSEWMPLQLGVSFVNSVDFLLPAGTFDIVAEVISAEGAITAVVNQITTTLPAALEALDSAQLIEALYNGTLTPSNYADAVGVQDENTMIQFLEFIVAALGMN